MPLKFAANLTHLWAELPFLDRFAAAADAGFEAVEVLYPYETAAKEIQRALMANGQQMVLMNAPPPNYTGGARGFAAQPENEDRFRHDMKRVFRYAQALRVPFVHVMTGEAEGDSARDVLVENLKWATEAAPPGITLTLEPLNQEAMPGYFLSDYVLASEVIEAVGAPNLGLQFDSYHAQVIHGDAVSVYEHFHPMIRHVQVGDAPKRSAPGTGTVDFPALFSLIESLRYKGWISAEYTPFGRTEETLAWMSR